MTDSKLPADAVRQVAARRIESHASGATWESEELQVVVEAPLVIDVDGFDTYTLLCTPLDTEALAAGFLLTEGIVEGMEAITTLRPCEDESGVIRVQLADPVHTIGEQGRNLLIVSSCGLCGVEEIGKKLEQLPEVGDRLRVECGQLKVVRDALREEQVLFGASGGSHAAGIFDGEGKLISWAEDAGRHNALDKAIGKCMLRGVSMVGCGVSLSGRASLDMVGKCARAGIELMSAVSAPTSLAIEVAERCNVTLCGFVRDTRATVFTHPRRIVGTEPA